MVIRLVEADSKQVRTISAMLEGAKKVVVVAGAGISTAAGIPDFRSSSGLNRQLIDKALNVKGGDLLREAIVRDADSLAIFCRYMCQWRARIEAGQVAPGPVHRYMFELWRHGRLQRCYTQNFDGLELKAGLVGIELQPSDNIAETKIPTGAVLQLHGRLSHVRCTSCTTALPWSAADTLAFQGSGHMACPKCTREEQKRREEGKRHIKRRTLSFMRPDIVLYGQASHPGNEMIERAFAIDTESPPDIILILGTTLAIAALKSRIQSMATGVHGKESGKVIVVNRTPTALARAKWVDYFLQMSCEDWLLSMSQIHPGSSDSDYDPHDPSEEVAAAIIDQSARMANGFRQTEYLMARYEATLAKASDEVQSEPVPGV